MRTFTFEVAALAGDAADLFNTPGLLGTADRSAQTLAADLRTLGVLAEPSADDKSIRVTARNVTAANDAAYAAVCAIIAASYRNEVAHWARKACAGDASTVAFVVHPEARNKRRVKF